MIQCTPHLIAAVKDNLTLFSGELLATGLITEDNQAALNNQFVDKAHWASQLVEFVRSRVSLDTGNYHSFIQILETRKDDHKKILKILDEEFSENVFSDKSTAFSGLTG